MTITSLNKLHPVQKPREKEHFLVLYLNTRNQLLAKEFVSIGTLNASLVHPREMQFVVKIESNWSCG